MLYLAAAFAALVPVLAHARFLSGDRIIYRADTAQLQYPRYVILTDALQEHRTLPLWQDLLYGGMPFHASPENPTLYPPVLALAAFLSPLWTINLTMLLHLAAAGLGMYLLVGRLWQRLAVQRGEPEGASSGPAAAGGALAATIFALSYTTRVDFIHLVTYGAAHALLPWILLAVDALLHGERPGRAAGLLALALAGLVFTGGLFVIAYAVPLLAVWFLGLGLLGGAQARRRTLTFGLTAAALAGLIVLAKILPYREWVGTTSREGRLPYDEALGVTLGGHHKFAWEEAWTKIKRTTGGGWALLPALLALPLLRHGVVRVAVLLALFFFGVALGGPAEALHRFVYEFVPPLDQTRSAIRAWVVPNAMLPLLAGLGTAWLLSRFALLRRQAWLPALLGMAAAGALAPGLDHSGPHYEPLIENPESLREVRSRYVHWPQAAERSGTEWRSVWFDHNRFDERTEQLISSLLRVETPAGYLGHVWPWRLEQHLYGPADARLPDDLRLRRLGVLSVKWLVKTDPTVPPPEGRPEVVPEGVDGTLLVENPFARPRVLLPSGVIGIAGESDDLILRTLLDSPHHPLGEFALVTFEDGGPAPSDDELRALDLLVLRGKDPRLSNLLVRARGFSVPVAVLGDDPARDRALPEVLARAFTLAREREPIPGHLERLRPGRSRVALPATERPRYVLVSEAWSLYPGWEVRSGSGAPLTVRRADGVVSALLVPAGTSAIDARFRPRSAFVGLGLGAVGVLVALLLVARRH